MIKAIDHISADPEEVSTPVGHNTGAIPKLATGENGVISYAMDEEETATEVENDSAPWAEHSDPAETHRGSERA